MLRATPIILAIVILAGACGGGVRNDDVSEFTTLVVGDCFNSLVSGNPDLTDATEFEETACAGSHDGEVVAVSTRSEDIDEPLFCLRQFEEYFDGSPDGLAPVGYSLRRTVPGGESTTVTICTAVSGDTSGSGPD